MADAISKERKLGQKHLKVHKVDKVLVHKVVCPVAECVRNVLFFEENGFPQHFRVAHKKN